MNRIQCPRFWVLMVGVLLPFIVACSKKEVLTIAGSSTVLPVVSKVAESFRQAHPHLNVIVNGGGSGVGINQVGEGWVDIGMTSRVLTAEEYKRYRGVNFITHPIGKDAVLPVVSSEIYDSGVQSLTLEQIGQIYKGEITNWKSLGGPDREILCIDKEASRGTRHVFMEAVFGDSDQAQTEAPGADLVLGSNNETQSALTQSNAAIGMLSFAWLNDDVKGLSIQTPKGMLVAPNLETIHSGEFPIIRDLLLVTNGEPQGAAKAFMDFILGRKGREIVTVAGYVPLAFDPLD